MTESDIKALTPVSCPHCNEPFVVEFTTSAPKLSGVFTIQMIEEAKKDAVKQVLAMGVDKDISKPVIDWINSPDTIFGPNDIDEIIKNIQLQHDTPQIPNAE